ncbi:hypothetical protein POM88_034687 [Heracleum sosnowskyi]|uniref:Uncharacterized protein n=1 Tax=Heracleum sosnowskyi TaxID=360622 RepID=A0AAD8MAS4_9APIA|nr:hypothetical protein POM88_034687 [Heracleum sosnowskyi]
MWSKADCTTNGEIKFTIKGNSYILSPSVINEALHLPVSNFENLPTDDEIISMFKFIKAFAPRCGGFNVITRFIQKIAYGLMYGRTIDIGTLLLKEISAKLGDMVHRSKVVFYVRVFMIIANYLSKEFSIDDRDDTLQVFVQGKRLFSKLVTRNLHAKVEFVLPRHVKVQLSTLSSSSLVTPKLEDVREDPAPPTQVVLPSQSQSVTRGTSSVSHTGKRKRTTLPTIIEDGSEKNETASEVHSPQKKKDESEVKPARSLFIVDHEIQPGEIWDGVAVMEPPSPGEDENKKCDLLFPA